MIKLIGFQSKCGQVTSDTTGEVIDWSNRTLRCVSDESTEDGYYGLAFVSCKLKKVQVCRSLGISEKSSEAAVDEALCRILNSEIQFTLGIVKNDYEINGFRVIKKN